MLKARLKTTGVVEHKFTLSKNTEFSGVEWVIYDVGGARNQRQAWAPYFDDGGWPRLSYISPSSLAGQLTRAYHSQRHYFPRADQCVRPAARRGAHVLALACRASLLTCTGGRVCGDGLGVQDTRVNRLEDSFMLWKSVIESKLLQNVNIVLFLNKCDLLEKKLESGVRLNHYMPSYNRPNDYKTVSQCTSLPLLVPLPAPRISIRCF